jgi:hypothetical protein
LLKYQLLYVRRFAATKTQKPEGAASSIFFLIPLSVSGQPVWRFAVYVIKCYMRFFTVMTGSDYMFLIVLTINGVITTKRHIL